AIRKTPEHAGQAERDISRVLGLPEALPFRVFGGVEDLAEVAGGIQSSPVGKVQHIGRGAGDERGMSRSRYMRHLLQELGVFRMLAEFVVANQCAEGRTAEDAVLFLINLLEESALVEFRSALQILQQLLLAAIQDLDLQHGSGFALIHQVSESAPSAL